MPVAASAQTEPAVSAHVGHLAPKRTSQGYSASNPGTMPPGARNCYTMQSSTSDCLANNLGQFTAAGISSDNSPMESTSQFFSAASSEMLDLGATLESSEAHETSPVYGLRESTRQRGIQELMSPGRARSTQYYTMEETNTRKSESPSRKKRKLAHPGSVVDLTGQSPPPAASQPWIEPSADTVWQPTRRLRCTSQRNCHTSGHRSPNGSRRRTRPERPTRRTESPERAAFQPPPPAPPAPPQQAPLPGPPPPQMANPPMMYEMNSATNPMSVPTFAIPVCTAPHHYPLCTGIHMPLCNTNTTWSVPGCGLPVPVCGVQHLPGCNFAQVPLTHAMPHNIVQSHRASHPLNHHPSQQPSAHQPQSSSSQSQSHQPHHSHHHQAHHPHPQHHQPVVSQPRGPPTSHPHPHHHPHSTAGPHFLSAQTPLQPREDGHILTEHRIPFTHIPHQGGTHRSAVAPSPAVLLQEPSVHPIPHGIYSPLSRLRRNSTSRSRWRSIPPPPPPYPGFLLHFLAMLGNPPMPAFGMDLGEIPHHPHNYDARTEQSTTRTALLNLAERLGETKPRGLLKADVDQLRSYRFKADKPRSSLGQSSCVVCMYDFESKQMLRVLPCDHEFHVKCVDKWLKSNRTCPICRKDASEPASKSE